MGSVLSIHIPKAEKNRKGAREGARHREGWKGGKGVLRQIQR